MTRTHRGGDDLDLIIDQIEGVSSLERAFARNRLKKYYDGGLPRWKKQVLKIGPVAMGYGVIGYLWLATAGILALAGSPTFFLRNRSEMMSITEVVIYGLALCVFIMALVRYTQGQRVGRNYIEETA
ncbi:MAG: hypothetical protein ACRDVC_02385 [Acidimicrobiales bacterium]